MCTRITINLILNNWWPVSGKIVSTNGGTKCRYLLAPRRFIYRDGPNTVIWMRTHESNMALLLMRQEWSPDHLTAKLAVPHALGRMLSSITTLHKGCVSRSNMELVVGIKPTYNVL